MRSLAILALALLAGCGARGTAMTTGAGQERDGDEGDDTRDYVGKDALVDYATLVFVDDAERGRFERARACFEERAKGWEHYPLRKIGNFVEEDWCRGEGAERGCSGGSFRERAGVDWAGVGTLHYPQDWPQVFGVQVSAGHLPAKGEWGVWFSVSTNGKSILGDGGSIGFRRVGDEASGFYVGTRYGWEIAESRFSQGVEGDGWALLERVRESPQALQKEAIEHWSALEAEVIGALERGEVLECVYGEYGGRGIPPECLRKVPLAAEKVEVEIARIRGKVAGVRKAFEEGGEGLYVGLMAVAPLGCS